MVDAIIVLVLVQTCISAREPSMGTEYTHLMALKVQCAVHQQLVQKSIAA